MDLEEVSEGWIIEDEGRKEGWEQIVRALWAVVMEVGGILSFYPV